MQEVLYVLFLALLPALGNFFGGLIAEFLHTSRINLNRVLHAAAGIIIAIVAVQLMPEALKGASAWVVALAFALGGIAYIIVEAVIEGTLATSTGAADQTGMWMIFIAVASDLFSDGLMIGTGAAVSSSLALILTLGQVLANMPEGFATIADFKDKQLPRTKRLLFLASFVVPSVLAALIAYLLLRQQSQALKIGGLVFTAGLLTVAAVEGMIAEAHEATADKRGSVLAFIGGFVLFTILTAGLKGAP